MFLNEKEIEAAGLDPKVVASLARRLEKVGREASALGICVFGGSGSGSLRFNDDNHNASNRPLVLAEVKGHFDGGDGATWTDDAGLLRGE